MLDSRNTGYSEPNNFGNSADSLDYVPKGNMPSLKQFVAAVTVVAGTMALAWWNLTLSAGRDSATNLTTNTGFLMKHFEREFRLLVHDKGIPALATCGAAKFAAFKNIDGAVDKIANRVARKAQAFFLDAGDNIFECVHSGVHEEWKKTIGDGIVSSIRNFINETDASGPDSIRSLRELGVKGIADPKKLAMPALSDEQVSEGLANLLELKEGFPGYVPSLNFLESLKNIDCDDLETCQWLIETSWRLGYRLHFAGNDQGERLANQLSHDFHRQAKRMIGNSDREIMEAGLDEGNQALIRSKIWREEETSFNVPNRVMDHVWGVTDKTLGCSATIDRTMKHIEYHVSDTINAISATTSKRLRNIPKKVRTQFISDLHYYIVQFVFVIVTGYFWMAHRATERAAIRHGLKLGDSNQDQSDWPLQQRTTWRPDISTIGQHTIKIPDDSQSYSSYSKTIGGRPRRRSRSRRKQPSKSPRPRRSRSRRKQPSKSPHPRRSRSRRKQPSKSQRRK